MRPSTGQPPSAVGERPSFQAELRTQRLSLLYLTDRHDEVLVRQLVVEDHELEQTLLLDLATGQVLVQPHDDPAGVFGGLGVVATTPRRRS